MKFLKKNNDSEVLEEGLNYRNPSQRIRIREVLLIEQSGFCAYSERYALNTDSIHIDHFDPRFKNTEDDNYNNWYAVFGWMNEHKPKNIEPFLPILSPSSIELNDRIEYVEGEFKETNTTDIEAKNLIKFLGLNRYELYNDRQNHISRIKSIRDMCENDEEFLEVISNNLTYLSFLTALEIELEMNLTHLLN